MTISEQPTNFALANQPCGICLCGCGESLRRDKRGRLREWSPYHSARGPKLDWEEKYRGVVANSPFCECGCGERVKPMANSPDHLRTIFGGHVKYPRFCLSHDKRPSGWSLILSEMERQCILGTLLGDGSISLPNKRSKNWKLAWTHGPKQAGWTYHKASVLYRLSPRVTWGLNDGYGDESVRMHTQCLPCLTEIARLVRPRGGKKTVTTNWLDQIGSIGLAWWYCDDGSFSDQRFAIFHTEGYSEPECNRIAKWFGGATQKNGRGHLIVRLPVARSKDLFTEIAPHVHPSMRYKLPASYR